MHRLLPILLVAATLYACAAALPGARDTPAASESEPLALARSFAIDETRAALPPGTRALSNDDVLALRSSDLHPDFGIGDREFRADQSAAVNGDGAAALRVAQMFRHGIHGAPRDERSMVLWLKRASELNNGTASYALYLYYLQRGLDREAVRFEKRALDQGFVPPPRLDPRRG